MNSTTHKVGDVGIRLISNVDLNPYRFFDYSPNYEAELLFFGGYKSNSLFENDNKRLIVSSKRPGGHELRQLMCYLADFNSNNYYAVHGCGFVIDSKGILLSGNHGSGKSTIKDMFPESSILDDDLLLIDNSLMYVSGKMGSISVLDKDGGKGLEYLVGEEVVQNSKIDFVFLLDKEHKGGYIKELNKIIPRKYSVIDALPYNLREEYMKLPDIEVNAPVFKIGTHKKPKLTKKVINEVIFKK